MVIRFSGVLLGNAMNNFGLRMYINPWLTPTLDYTDPRWIGAWWFTPAVLGLLFIIPAVLISRFPSRLPTNKTIDCGNANAMPLLTDEAIKEIDSPEKPSLQDMKTSLGRLLRNKIFVYTILAFIARRLGNMPYHTYMVKYMEQLYNVSSADAK